MAAERMTVALHGQRGVVLPVTMVLLVLVTLVTFSAMRSGTIDQRIASAAEVKALAFQSAESAITRVTEDIDNLPPPQDGATDTRAYSFAITGDKTINVAVGLRFKTESSAPGYSIRKGSAGFQTYFYDVSPEAAAAGTDLRSELTEGVFVEAPRVN